jgi:hypothetical protein
VARGRLDLYGDTSKYIGARPGSPSDNPVITMIILLLVRLVLVIMAMIGIAMLIVPARSPSPRPSGRRLPVRAA